MKTLAPQAPSHARPTYQAQAKQLTQAIARLSPQLRAKLDATLLQPNGAPTDSIEAAALLAQKLPELAQSLESGVEARIEQTLKGLSKAAKQQPMAAADALSDGAVRALGYAAAVDATAKAPATARLLTDPKVQDALATLGLEHLRPGDLAENFASALSAMAKAVAETAGESTQPFVVQPSLPPSQRKAQMARAVEATFGPAPASGTHVLVTMDSAAALEPQTVPQLFDAGMSVVRINNAHDTAQTRTDIAIRVKTVALERSIAQMPVDAVKALEAAVGVSKDELVKVLAADTAQMRSLETQGLLPTQPRLLADLAGPKNRTGLAAELKGTVKVSVPRSEEGIKMSRSAKVDQAARKQLGRFVLSLEDGVDAQGATRIPFELKPKHRLEALQRALKSGEVTLIGHDENFSRHREMRIDGLIERDGRVVGLKGRVLDSTFFTEGMHLSWRKSDSRAPLLEVGRVGELPKMFAKIEVADGDTLLLKADPEFISRDAEVDGSGKVVPASIGCQLPEAFASVKVGERVLLDDGKVRTRIVAIHRDQNGTPVELELKVGPETQDGTAARRYAIGVEKGINFPDSVVDVPALTDKDIEDLAFTLAHCDTVAYSFVQSAADVAVLVERIKEKALELGLATPETLDAFLSSKGICAKIETKAATDNVEEIMLAIERYGLKPSAMVARGDYAVELGFDNLGEAQADLMRRLDLGGWPYIYATQIMETRAKKGVDSRAEWVDLHTGVRGFNAPVIMLNKGPYTHEVVADIHALASKPRNGVGY